MLESFSERLEPIYLVLNSDDNTGLREITRLLERNSTTLEAIEEGLRGIDVSPRTSQGQHERGGGSIFRSFYGGKKQDRVQDKRNGENKGKVQDNSVFRDDGESDDSGDEDSPYARIDTLQRQILRRRQMEGVESPPRVTLSQDSAVPAPGRPLNISAQVFSMPSQHKSTPSLIGPDMYERVEEVLPSPFLNYDIVSARTTSSLSNLVYDSLRLHETPCISLRLVRSLNWACPNSTYSNSLIKRLTSSPGM